MEILINPSKVRGSVKVPGSKSLTHRALICAAFSNTTTTITNACICDDTLITIKLLENIGVKFLIDNNNITIYPPHPFTKPKEIINAHNSGSSIRFIGPIYWELFHEFKIYVDKRMYERLIETTSQNDLSFSILTKTSNSYLISFNFKNLSNLINNEKTSQYTSGIILSTIISKNKSYFINPSVLKNPYVKMTLGVMEEYHITYHIINNIYSFLTINPQKFNYQIESDYTAAANFLVMGCLNGDVKCLDLKQYSLQGDSKIINYLMQMNAHIFINDFNIQTSTKTLVPGDFDLSDTPDLIPLIAGLLVVTPGISKITGIEKLVYKETNRLNETINLLTELGGSIKLENKALIIHGKTQLLNKQSLIIPDDHRLLMMVVAISSKFFQPIKLINVESINKSYPNFINDYMQIKETKP